jgi:ubiquinone/menaquinone biosynthesis C-methylase UbiE
MLAPDLKFDIEYMKAAANRPGVRALKELSYELLRLKPGSQVVDIGCGPGIDTVEIAKRVGTHGRVVGIDHDPEMIHAANEYANREQVSAKTEHRVGSCLDVPYDDACFDACRCERVLQHLTPVEGVRALSEALRTLRPGGRIVFLDTDWATLSIHSPNPLFERRLVQWRINGWRNGYAARSMPELFFRSGIKNVVSETRALRLEFPEINYLISPMANLAISTGQITPYQWVSWHSSLRQASEKGTFYASVNMVLCYGTGHERASP